MTRLVLLGAAGRMGKALVRCLQTDAAPDLQLVGAVDIWDAPERGQDAGLAAGTAPLGVTITTDLADVIEQADVVVDFSSHHGTAGNVQRLADWKKPAVLGTTGLTADEQKVVQDASRIIPIVQAPNMSLGVNLLLALVEQAATALRDKGFDIEIVERHHRRKKDAPSGTALALGAAAAAGAGLDLTQAGVHGRSGLTGERPERQIGFHAVRGGDIVGDHTVLFAADGECLELGHRATSRDAFALGALRAAAWVAGRGPGLYSMRDVLGI